MKALYVGVGLLAVVIEHLVSKIVTPLKKHYQGKPWDLITPAVALVLSLLVGMKAGLNVFEFIPGLADWSGVLLTSALLWFGAQGIYEILKQLAEWTLKVSDILEAIVEAMSK